jgi:prepilin-type N-terminal cleavage/methylation domain-containing protein
MKNAPARGFTLIELMVVVAVIGLLSSVAIPTFRNFQLRSKQAERNVILTSIHRAVDDYWMREGHYPIESGSGATATSWLYLFYWNPDSTPGTQKRPWRQKPLNQFDHWNALSLRVDGSVYYSYYGYAYDQPGYRYQYLYALGDLDGDGIQDQLEKYWYVQNNRLLKYPGTWDCIDCTYEIRTPNDNRAF